MDAVFLAVLVFCLKFVADLAESIEVDPSFLDDALNDLVLLTQEILEGAILLKIAASFFGFLVLIEVQQVVWNLVERNVVYVQRLGQVESRDMAMAVSIILVELVVPE